MAEPDADIDALAARMDALQSAIDAADGWELERQLQRATDALRCPPGATSFVTILTRPIFFGLPEI